MTDLNTSVASGKTVWNLLKGQNLANTSTTTHSFLFSPKDASSVGVSVSVLPITAVVNENGFVGRAANGRFEALAARTKGLIKFVNYSSIALPALNWSQNTCRANIQNVRGISELLDGVSAAVFAGEISLPTYVGLLNDAVVDGASMENLYDSLDGKVCKTDAFGLVAIRNQLDEDLQAVPTYQNDNVWSWTVAGTTARRLLQELGDAWRHIDVAPLAP